MPRKNNENPLLAEIFKNCFDIVRTEGLTGEKALRNISYLLVLKLIETHFGKEMDIDNYKYDFNHIDAQLIEPHKTKLLELVRFSNLAKESENDILTSMQILWDDILSKNPSTKNIFLSGKGFDIQKKSTFTSLINKLNSIDITNTEFDILGCAYEEVIRNIMKGKVLGQFFTPLNVKKIMIDLINPQIHDDGKIETCCDPTMGTGGLLITYLTHILQQAKTKNINPNWNFIINEGIYGKEIESDTYQLAVSNMLIKTGHMFGIGLERGDSICEPITRKFDNVIANPPFGIKGLEYGKFQDSLKTEYIPHKTDNVALLFLQIIICILNVSGKCAVVMPSGQELFSIESEFVKVREYLMKTCELKEVIYLPSGIFTNTPIKTCIFYFVKKCNGTNVLQTGKHQTTKVNFYDYDMTTNEKVLLKEIPIENIANNSYSLNYSEYMNVTNIISLAKCEIKTFGEICIYLKKSKRKAGYGKTVGKYPFFTSSQDKQKYCDTCDYDEEALIIGTGGNANIKHCTNFSCSADNLIVKMNEGVLTKYVYYFLRANIGILQHEFHGATIGHITKERLNAIKIPVPSIEQQTNFVRLYEQNEIKTKLLETEIENNAKVTNQLAINILVTPTIIEPLPQQPLETKPIASKRKTVSKQLAPNPIVPKCPDAPVLRK